jgi:2-methylcitrate dehydratase PrpD
MVGGDSGSLTKRLAALIASKPIIAADRETAALFVLDLIANAVGSRTAGPGQIVADWSASTGGDAGRQAFVMGALGHTLEMDDLHRQSVVHPGCVVIPAAWAAALAAGATGHQLLDAVLKGFEAACRIGSTVGGRHYEIWHNTATCGPFGAAMATGHILGLDPSRTVDALGNAGTQSSGLWEFLEAGAMSKHLHAGRAAESGLMAAQLAQAGLTGPDTILEGPKGFYAALCPDPAPGILLEQPDAPWALTQTSMKPWPSCRHTHPAIDAAGELRGGFDPADVDWVTVETYGAALAVCDRPAPATDYDAKFSLQHCAAVALLTDDIGFGAFDENAREKFAALRNKVSLEIGPSIDEAYPTAWGANVTVALSNGTRQSARRMFAKGDPEAALSREEVSRKAEMLMRHGGLDAPLPLANAVLGLADDAPLPALPLPLFGP